MLGEYIVHVGCVLEPRFILEVLWVGPNRWPQTITLENQERLDWVHRRCCSILRYHAHLSIALQVIPEHLITSSQLDDLGRHVEASVAVDQV